MKKLSMIIIACLLLTACAGTPDQTDPTDTSTAATTTQPTTDPVTEATTQPETAETQETTAPSTVKFTLCTPNENFDGFNTTDVVINELDANAILRELVNENVLNGDISILSAILTGSDLAIDLNSAFADLIVTQGSTGERMILGSVVNSFLSAYGAETVTITVDGGPLESGHVVYDFPMTFFN